MGYSKDIRLNTPAVMDLNMRAASLAGLFVRHIYQPFLATPLPHTVRETVTNFSPKPQRLAPAPDCIVCNCLERLGSCDRFRLSTRATASIAIA